MHTILSENTKLQHNTGLDNKLEYIIGVYDKTHVDLYSTYSVRVNLN